MNGKEPVLSSPEFSARNTFQRILPLFLARRHEFTFPVSLKHEDADLQDTCMCSFDFNLQQMSAPNATKPSFWNHLLSARHDMQGGNTAILAYTVLSQLWLGLEGQTLFCITLCALIFSKLRNFPTVGSSSLILSLIDKINFMTNLDVIVTTGRRKVSLLI